MNPFDYHRPTEVAGALALLDGDTPARPIGGGTNLVDLMREGIETPAALVDVGRLALDQISSTNTGWRVGATVTNTDLATHSGVRASLPMLSAAIVSGATGQIRNMATVGGNLMQRTRCAYFSDHVAPCNKRRPGSGCGALDGFHRSFAILGTSDSCISVHPSDLCVALVALDATIELTSATGVRTVSVEDFYREPGTTPHVEHALAPGELITAVEVPTAVADHRQAYRKVRDRASYAFALVSVAAALTLDGDTVSDLRLALGGVGTRPWRAHTAEAALVGRPLTDEAVREAIRAELTPARTHRDTAFKVGLTERTVVAVLRDLRTRTTDSRQGGAR